MARIPNEYRPISYDSELKLCLNNLCSTAVEVLKFAAHTVILLGASLG